MGTSVVGSYVQLKDVWETYGKSAKSSSNQKQSHLAYAYEGLCVLLMGGKP